MIAKGNDQLIAATVELVLNQLSQYVAGVVSTDELLDNARSNSRLLVLGKTGRRPRSLV